MRHIPIQLHELPELGKETSAEASLEEKHPECFIRFPFFDKVWNGSDIDVYEDDALDHFPEVCEVWAMLSSDEYNKFSMSPGDRHFWKNLKCCPASEIYFLDPYFSAANLARLFDVAKSMDCQSDRELTCIFIFTCAGDEWKALKSEFEKHHDLYAGLEKISLTVCRINEIIARKVHDRFAVLGSSLWHFGASAGAMHTNIHAYSGPWPDKGGKCMEFMRGLRKHHVADEVSTMRKGMRR